MKQFVRYYLRIKSKCMKVTYLFNFIILILLGSCISKELIKEANENYTSYMKSIALTGDLLDTIFVVTTLAW